MNQTSKWESRYVVVDVDDPDAIGQCDTSGFVFNHKDLVKQMDWRGNSLVWTGLMVGKPFVDKPCQQNRPPVFARDPIPVKNPRIPTPYTEPSSRPAPPDAVRLDELRKGWFI